MDKFKLLIGTIGLAAITFITVGCGNSGSGSGSGGGGCVGNDSRIVLQAESGSGAGQRMPRANANGSATILLKNGETRSISFQSCAGVSAMYSARVRYSNDSNGPSETISLTFNNVLVGQFGARDTGDFGRGWDNFAEDGIPGTFMTQPGTNTVTVSISGGDGFGVEIDAIILEKR
jgi:hypothetical protein